MKLSSRRR